ncbi:MAG: 50S ribosomal protein L18, partial [Ilumatobacter sp.]
PRHAAHRSNRHISAQAIDDDSGRTLAAASTTETDLRASGGGSVDAANRVGVLVAERGMAAGVRAWVVDRGCYRYQWRIAAVASAAREAGLEF